MGLLLFCTYSRPKFVYYFTRKTLLYRLKAKIKQLEELLVGIDKLNIKE